MPGQSISDALIDTLGDIDTEYLKNGVPLVISAEMPVHSINNLRGILQRCPRAAGYGSLLVYEDDDYERNTVDNSEHADRLKAVNTLVGDRSLCGLRYVLSHMSISVSSFRVLCSHPNIRSIKLDNIIYRDNTSMFDSDKEEEQLAADVMRSMQTSCAEEIILYSRNIDMVRYMLNYCSRNMSDTITARIRPLQLIIFVTEEDGFNEIRAYEYELKDTLENLRQSCESVYTGIKWYIIHQPIEDAWMHRNYLLCTMEERVRFPQHYKQLLFGNDQDADEVAEEVAREAVMNALNEGEGGDDDEGGNNDGVGGGNVYGNHGVVFGNS